MSQEGLRRRREDVKKQVAKKIDSLINDDLRNEIEETIRSITNRVVDEVIDKNVNGKLASETFEVDRATDRGADKNEHGRIYVAQDSLLTDLLKISHIRTLYHICVVILILLFLNTIIYDLLDKGSINIGLRLIIIAFGKLDIVAITWLVMQTFTFLPYYAMTVWLKHRHDGILGKLHFLKYVGVVLYLSYLLVLLIAPISVVVRYKLPIASSFIVLTESIRFMMKSHSFVRTMTPRIMNSSLKISSSIVPTFSWYLYFLFAPTLIYRDSYPRTKQRDWKKVVIKFSEVLVLILYMNSIFERHLVHTWSTFGIEKNVIELKQIVTTYFSCMFPAILTFICGFYLLLHSWHNATAELLTFADKKFYLDWWNQTTYTGYYRTWNMIVHDWLHLYVYRELLGLLGPGRRTLATVAVFVTSAVIHELLIAFSFGFFYPVLLVLFGVFGMLLVFVTRGASSRAGNVSLWLQLIVGNGAQWCLYAAEYYARANSCPPAVDNQLLDLFVPRSWSCRPMALAQDWKFRGSLGPFGD